MAPARKTQFPTKEEWKQHKDEIVRLYVTEDMRLDDVRERMEREHNFKAKYAGTIGSCSMLTEEEIVCTRPD